MREYLTSPEAQRQVLDYLQIMLGRDANLEKNLIAAQWDVVTYCRQRGLDRDIALNRISGIAKLPVLPSGTAFPSQPFKNWLHEIRPHYKLASPENGRLPWIPITLIGTVPVMGHFLHTSPDHFGIPPKNCIHVLLHFDTYWANYVECMQLMANASLPLDPTTEDLRTNIPERPLVPTAVSLFEWLLKNKLALDGNKYLSLTTPLLQSRLDSDVDLSFGLEVLQRGVNAPPLWTLSIAKESVDALPTILAKSYNALCYLKLRLQHYVVMIDPSQAKALEEELNSRNPDPNGTKRVIASFAPMSILNATQEQVSGYNQVVIRAPDGAVSEAQPARPVDLQLDTQVTAAIPEITGKEEPELIVDYLIHRGILMNSSDIHLETDGGVGKVRFRLNGKLKVVGTFPLKTLNMLIAVIKVRAKMDPANRREPQDKRISLNLDGRSIVLRVSTLPNGYERESAVLRILDTQASIHTLDDLQLANYQLNIYNETISRDYGLILVTGPTGSGKTSTLHAMLQAMNDPSYNIITIEDPIEIELAGAKQVQVDTDANLSFAVALRAAMRHDPDIIMVGEIRDKETAEMAIQSALTGHMVLSTLHTNDALRSITRLRDLGIESSNLADCLILLQAQRLIRNLCYCKVPRVFATPEAVKIHREIILRSKPTYALMSDEAPRIFRDFANGELTLYQNKGCWHCNNTGFSGRRAIMELCPVTENLRAMIASKRPYTELYAQARLQGLRSLYEEGLREYLVGSTSYEEIQGLRDVGGMEEVIAAS